MRGKGYIIDPSELNFDHIIADSAAIREFNPQRFEMEQLRILTVKFAPDTRMSSRTSFGSVVICPICR